MAFASGSSHGLSYQVETAGWGNPPTTPNMTALRHTSCSLMLSKDAFESQELRSDRQISDVRLGADKVGGEIGIELSYGEFDTLFESLFYSTWTTNNLLPGITRKALLMERQFADITQFALFRGCIVNTFNLSLKPNAIVTGSFGFVGKSCVYSGTSADATITASQTNAPFDTFSGSLLEGGSGITCVTGLDLSITNNIDPAFVIASKTAAEMPVGRFKVTGTVSAFFENSTLLNKFINETNSTLVFTLGGGANKKYTFTMSKLIYTSGDNPVNGEGPININMGFQGVYSGATDSSLKLTRIP